jgi:hypothetical protein
MQILLACQPRNPRAERERVAATAEAWRARYAGLLGRPFRLCLRHERAGSLVVLHEEDAPDGRPAIERLGPARHHAWAGICETPPETPDALAALLREHPERSAELDGRFLSALLDEEEILLTQASVEPCSAWMVEGPLGWAAGTRIAPLLELAGRPARPDLDAMSAFACYGWVPGRMSLFEGVARIERGMQVRVRSGRAEARTVAPLATLCRGPDDLPRSAGGLAERAGTRLRERLQRQVALARNPVLHLSGGRDCRMILAAAKGLDLQVETLGPAWSDEVITAETAARAAGLPWRRRETGSIDRLLRERPGEAEAFVRWHEGLDKLSHLGSNLDWPARATRGPDTIGGKGGELGRGAFYAKYLKGLWRWLPGPDRARNRSARTTILRRRLGKFGARNGASAGLRESFRRCDEACADLGGDTFAWLDLFYFVERVGHWGADARATRSSTNTNWSPLIDRVFLQCALALPQQIRKDGARWPALVIASLAPEFERLPYAGSPEARRLARARRNEHAGDGERAPTDPPGWKALLERPDAVYPELVEPDRVRRILADERAARKNEKFLWQLASMELFHRVFFESPPAESDA